MLERSLPLIEKEGTIGNPQLHNDNPILPRRKPADGLINFNNTSKELYNFIRALARPYPGAFFNYKETQVIIWKASYSKGLNTTKEAGVIIDYIYSFNDEDCSVIISTKDGALIISEVMVNDNIIKGKKLHVFFKLNDKI